MTVSLIVGAVRTLVEQDRVRQPYLPGSTGANCRTQGGFATCCAVRIHPPATPSLQRRHCHRISMAAKWNCPPGCRSAGRGMTTTRSLSNRRRQQFTLVSDGVVEARTITASSTASSA